MLTFIIFNSLEMCWGSFQIFLQYLIMYAFGMNMHLIQVLLRITFYDLEWRYVHSSDVLGLRGN